jgi:hypothetical protein
MVSMMNQRYMRDEMLMWIILWIALSVMFSFTC